MRVLMLGWDFSPRLSGGVGSACQGLANALARAPLPLGTEVLFVLPRLRGDEEAENVRLLVGGGKGAPRQPHVSALARSSAVEPPAQSATRRGAARTDDSRRDSSAAPTALLPEVLEQQPERPSGPGSTPDPGFAHGPGLPTPAEALRLLAIDSPMRPYLSPADYADEVHRILVRFQQPAQRASVRARKTVRGIRPRTSPLASALASTPVIEDVRQPLAPARPGRTELAPRYGLTLSSEVARYAREVLALTQSERFDVIHVHDWMTFPAGLLLQERTGKPLVVHFHSTEAERRGKNPAAEARAIEQAALDAAERVVCVSEAGADALRANYAIEYAKLRVVHNAHSPLAASTPRKRPAGPVVLYLGRLSEQKSPDVFLRSAPPVLERHPQARFVLAGDGALVPELKALAKELGLGQRVSFTGFVKPEELAHTYAGADVYVLSSASEPFGISALEALSLGVPTIVPRGAGVTEVVRNVLRFEPGNVEELSDKIVALIERPALRSQLSAGGLREVKKLRWDRPARALRAIYDEVARSAP